MIVPESFWPRRVGECWRKRRRHGAARAVGVANILEQVAARPPWSVVAPSDAARRPRRVGALGLGAQPHVFLDHLGHDRLNRDFQFALPVGLGNDTRLARIDGCARACLTTGLARCGIGGFSRAYCATAINACCVRRCGCMCQPRLFGWRFQVQQHQCRNGFRLHKAPTRMPLPATQQDADHQHVPTQNECQNAELSECLPLSHFHVAFWQRTRRASRRAGF